MTKFDAVVIGAGNGGLVAAIRLLQGARRYCSWKNTIFRADSPRVFGGEGLSLKRPCTN